MSCVYNLQTATYLLGIRIIALGDRLPVWCIVHPARSLLVKRVRLFLGRGKMYEILTDVGIGVAILGRVISVYLQTIFTFHWQANGDDNPVTLIRFCNTALQILFLKKKGEKSKVYTITRLRP